MPVEIREIVIKTEITVGDKRNQTKLGEKDLIALRRQLLEELNSMVNKQKTWKNIHNR